MPTRHFLVDSGRVRPGVSYTGFWRVCPTAQRPTSGNRSASLGFGAQMRPATPWFVVAATAKAVPVTCRCTKARNNQPQRESTPLAQLPSSGLGFAVVAATAQLCPDESKHLRMGAVAQAGGARFVEVPSRVEHPRMSTNFLIQLAPQPMGASFVTPWAEVRDACQVAIHVVVPGGDGEGDFTIEGSNDPLIAAERWRNPALPSNAAAVDITSWAYVAGDAGVLGAASVMFGFFPVPVWVRVRFTRVGGGAGVSANIWIAGNGAAP